MSVRHDFTALELKNTDRYPCDPNIALNQEVVECAMKERGTRASPLLCPLTNLLLRSGPEFFNICLKQNQMQEEVPKPPGKWAEISNITRGDHYYFILFDSRTFQSFHHMGAPCKAKVSCRGHWYT